MRIGDPKFQGTFRRRNYAKGTSPGTCGMKMNLEKGSGVRNKSMGEGNTILSAFTLYRHLG